MNDNSLGSGALSNVQKPLWSGIQYAEITILRPELGRFKTPFFHFEQAFEYEGGT